MFMGDQSSLDEYVLEVDIHNVVVPGVDISAHFYTAAHDVFSIKGQPLLAAKAPWLRSFCDQRSPLPNIEDFLLDLPGNLHCFWVCNLMSSKSS